MSCWWQNLLVDVIPIGSWCLVLFFQIFTVPMSYWKFNTRKAVNKKEFFPGVSIIKPLCGIDPNLKNNLETFFTMHYSTYEILFCVKEESDPCVGIVKDLLKRFPDVDAKLLLSNDIKPICVNPKIRNMHPAYNIAKFPWILISDSGIRMKQHTLLNMVSYMTSTVGIVFQMPFVCDRSGFAAALEKVYFGTKVAKPNVFSDFFGFNIAQGMSCLVRKAALDQCGGLLEFGKYLAEDAFMSFAIKNNGWQISMCAEPAWQNAGFCDVPMFHDRLIRWMRLRYTTCPLIPFVELLLYDFFAFAFLTAWVLYRNFDVHPASSIATHLAVWSIVDWLMLRSVQNGPLNFSLLIYLQAWIFDKICSPYLMIRAIRRCRVIKWKSGSFRHNIGGLVVEEP